jgi:hypothetical protein
VTHGAATVMIKDTDGDDDGDNDADDDAENASGQCACCVWVFVVTRFADASLRNMAVRRSATPTAEECL